VPLVEVVMGTRSDPAIAEGLVDFLRTCGKVPVLVRKDRPGQLGNRIQHAMVRECMHIVAEGIASPEDVDLAVKAGFGLRLPVYGVFEHADLVGLELVKAVHDYVLPDLGVEQGSSPLLNEKLAKGERGAASGRGFLDWPPGKAEAVRAARDAFLVDFLRSHQARPPR
jgi:3-hydroxybutyryl-CoA dehydrogenase